MPRVWIDESEDLSLPAHSIGGLEAATHNGYIARERHGCSVEVCFETGLGGGEGTLYVDNHNGSITVR
jgi:hypothetical protein